MTKTPAQPPTPHPSPHPSGHPPRHPRHHLLHGLAALALLQGVAALASTPAELLAGYSAQAGQAPQPARGQQFFTSKHGHDWACADCHGATPTQTGRHAVTAKSITPLAPAFQAGRFTDPAKVEKWFRRNCNDVAGRDCSAAEKADMLAWLLTLKP